MKIHYPHKPYIITQAWGNPTSAYSTQFGDPAFKRHNGIDANTGKVDWQGKVLTEYPVYCPVGDFIVAGVMFEPNGGGNELWLESIAPMQIGDKFCHARIFLCHAKKVLVEKGDTPKLGQLLMIADSTGFSTGLHTHMGLYRIDTFGNKIDVNDATGSYNPAPFLTGSYAIDQATLPTLIKNAWTYYTYRAGL